MMRRATIFALLLGLSAMSGCEAMFGEGPCPPPGCDTSCDPCAQPFPCPAPCAPASCCPETGLPESGPARSAFEWVADLRSDDRVTRERAVGALARTGPSVLPEVEALLSDPSATVRYSALQVLVRLRGAAWPSVYVVKHHLSDPDVAVRAEAAYVISQAGWHAAEAIPELICAMNDSSPVVRYRAAVAFQHMDRLGEPGRNALARVCRCDRDPRVREAACCALYKLDEAVCRQPDVRR